MIQFNLLPDVKQEFIKARRAKRTAITAATVIGGGALFVFIMLFLVVNVVQKKHLRDLDQDIKQYSQQLQATPDLNKILTIQNQLNSLPALHDDKIVASRLPQYLGKLTPAKASISKLQIDFSAKTITITGTADSLSTVNKYVDTIKFTKYTTTKDSSQKAAFNNVVLGTFSRQTTSTSFTITANFEAAIFDNEAEVSLVVPKIISTRSETEKPAQLFQKQGGQ